MIDDIIYPKELTSSELDNYLAKGWFRLGQSIFTTEFVITVDDIFFVYWIRLAIEKINFGRRMTKILKRNAGLNFKILPFSITPEVEALYDLYKNSVSFRAPDSIRDYLLNGADSNLFNSKMIIVNDNNKLISVGIFDIAETSLAGIINFYHPDYKKHSLGLYLMLLTIKYAKQLRKQWYYPGYIIEANTKFNYKLLPDINATEVFDFKQKEWIPFSWEAITKFSNDTLG